MARYLTAEAAIGGDPAQLNGAADTLDASGRRATRLVDTVRDGATGTTEFWRGPAGDAYRGAMGRTTGTVRDLPDRLTAMSGEFRTLAGELSSAQGQARDAMRASVRIGMGEGDLIGRPDRVAAFVSAFPAYHETVAHLLGLVATARGRAERARTYFSGRIRTVRRAISEAGGGDDRREPDERGGRRIEDDRRRGRPEGGDPDRGDDFDSDWAGRAILERYLRGGPDWHIDNDPRWNRYMMDDVPLREQVELWTRDEARRAVQDYQGGLGDTRTFDRRFHAELANGEAVVGSQFLHGTHRGVGGFEFSGDSVVTPRADGDFDVTINGSYTWHDRIDPNFGYGSDRDKSLLADIFTLGQADPYDIHITWPQTSTVVVDRNGFFVGSRGGWPSPPP
ncbi:WXG100 family type VII secretion target [Catenuloplanes atrovinosus]|uniref:Uncharacterized protein n=1 Tax=Catenuloplanes atrovinosus TaxID=137266 RepID=A0AAE3YPY2_9ACTN|nr:hypothetical protein [Catenuloplanes atrovinosus]MDR7276273.1 hypothetical protein [Catenuloplanes atrovinosus]